jgi:hypothetical protein
MEGPQDLPGRYGRVIKALDKILKLIECESVLGGGWAVWRHGYVGRVTEDVDIALPASQIDKFLKVASVSGFEILPHKPGRWPKVRHKATTIKVDILPEGARPGVAGKLAPTTIPHPAQMGAKADRLRYIRLVSLFELKLAAGREQDLADVVALIRANQEVLGTIRQHLQTVHEDYVAGFDRLVVSARAQKKQED